MKIFLSYAHEDMAAARKLYTQLQNIPGMEVWFDKESLKPGQRWELAIKDAITGSDYLLLLLSQNSTGKQGYYQREVRLALRVLEEIPENKIFLIPIRLDDCRPHFEELNVLNYVDFFPDWEAGLARVLDVINPNASAPEHRDTERLLKLRVHQAQFVSSASSWYYFINATNLSSSKALELTHVWYEDEENHIPVVQVSRPLPVRLEVDQSWETWIDYKIIPKPYRLAAFDKFRARISTGAVFKSEANLDIPPYGYVPGGSVQH